MRIAAFSILIIALLCAGAGLLLNRYRKRRIHNDVLHAVSMEEAWQAWPCSISPADAGCPGDKWLLTEMDAAVRESVHRSLLEFETRLRSDAMPLARIRRELMDSVDRRALNTEILGLPEDIRLRLRQHSREILQSDAETHTYLAANELRMRVLREYSALHYGDRVKGDWFDIYEKASHLRQKSTRLYIERTLSGSQSTLDDARYQTITRVEHEIRARLLQVPAGTRFPGFDEPGTGSSGQN